MKVLFNADDFGLTKGVTDGIIQAHTNGLIQSTTLMMNGLAWEYAVKQAKEHKNLKIGIHLVLTWGKPLSNNNEVSGLINKDGSFIYTKAFEEMKAPDLMEVEKEWRAQINAFLATGLTLHHIDSHHHIHGWEILKDVVVRLAKDYQVPVRFMDSLREKTELLLTDTIWLDFYEDGVNEAIFDKLQDVKFDSIEIMTHPGIVDDDLRNVSSYQDKREEELAILCSLDVPEWVENLE